MGFLIEAVSVLCSGLILRRLDRKWPPRIYVAPAPTGETSEKKINAQSHPLSHQSVNINTSNENSLSFLTKTVRVFLSGMAKLSSYFNFDLFYLCCGILFP